MDSRIPATFFRITSPRSTFQERPDARKILLLAPGLERIDGCRPALLLKFIHTIGQIAEAGQHSGPVAIGGAAVVFAQSDVAAVVSAILDSRPVGANGSQYLVVGSFLQSQTRCIVADLQRGRFFGLVMQLAVTLHRDDLPAAAQTDLLRGYGHSGQTPAVKAAVLLLPFALRGENPAGPAGVGLYRGCHFGCL